LAFFDIFNIISFEQFYEEPLNREVNIARHWLWLLSILLPNIISSWKIGWRVLSTLCDHQQ